MKKLVLGLLIISVFSVSCRQVFGKKVRGNGKIATETRSVTGFMSLTVSGDIDIYLSQDSTASVSVKTDENIIDHVETYEEGGILYVRIRKGYNPKPTDAIKVYVSAPVFRKISASGACNVYTSGRLTSSESFAIRLSGASDAEVDIKAPKVTADLTGAGTLKLKGETRDLELDGTGSSELECLEMMAENVSVDITGSGDADVFASVSLDVSVTGSGTVKYKGSPAVSQKISGAGSVKKIP